MIRKFLVVFGTIGTVVGTIFAFGIVIAIMGSMAPKPERTEPQSFAPTVFVQEVSYGETQLTVYAQGEVRPKQEINLTSQVGGKITSVSEEFADGGVIEKGQILVQIEDADYRLAVTRAQAQVAQSKTALEIEQAEAELARQDYEELSGISGSEGPSDLTLRRPQLARAEADYQAALANLRDAELALGRTSIRAPFNGRVRSISANTGQFISPGQQLGRIFSTDVAEIRLPLTDEDLGRLNMSLAFNDPKNGPNVKLSVIAAGAERNWTGRVVRVDAAIDASTRQVAAIVQVLEPYGAGSDNGFPLAVGLFVDAEIEGPVLDRAVTLPRVAIVDGGSVFVVTDEDTVEKRPVTIAAYTRDGAVITAGLEPGERVAVSRVAVPEGTEIRPLDPSAPTADRETDESEDGGDVNTADAASAGSEGAVQ
jgi:RND family efflux transporter MFP subunit